MSIAFSNLCVAFTIEEFILKPQCSSTYMLFQQDVDIFSHILAFQIFLKRTLVMT